MTPEQTSVTEQTDWQRLSPVSIIYFIIKFTISAVKEWFVNSIPALAAFAFMVDNKLFWLCTIVPTLLLLLFIFGFLYYWYFRFQAKDGEIIIQRGIISKEHLNLQYSRVQNVNIGRPFYFAPLKLVNCIIESAGSKATEVNLPGVSEAFALAVRRDVFAAEKIVDASQDKPAHENSTDIDTSKPMLRLSNWESAKSGLTSYVAFIALAALAPFMDKFSGFIAGNIFPSLMDLVEPVVGHPVIAGIVIVVISSLLIFLLITSASVVGAFVRYYRFEPYNSEDKLVRVAGLLERKSTTLTKMKVQSVLIKQNLIARLLNRVSLQYRQVGVSQTNDNNNASVKIPMLEPVETNRFTSAVFSDCPKPDFVNIHPSYVTRVFFYFWLLPATVIVSMSVLLLSKYCLLALMLLAPIFVLLKLQYRRYGFWFNEDFGAIRSGLFGQSMVIFPLYKVQITKVRQSRGQKRRNVGNLHVQLGSGSESIPYLPMDLLNNFVNSALFKTESSPKAWM